MQDPTSSKEVPEITDLPTTRPEQGRPLGECPNSRTTTPTETPARAPAGKITETKTVLSTARQILRNCREIEHLSLTQYECRPRPGTWNKVVICTPVTRLFQRCKGSSTLVEVTKPRGASEWVLDDDSSGGSDGAQPEQGTMETLGEPAADHG